jgi:hypothetical protein
MKEIVVPQMEKRSLNYWRVMQVNATSTEDEEKFTGGPGDQGQCGGPE